MVQSEDNGINCIQQLIQLKPVGIVRNQNRGSEWGANYRSLAWQETAARMKAQSQAVSELAIDPELEGILDGIDDFSHLIVLYWAHLVPDKRRSVKRVHPLASNDFPPVGVFATHSPARPNPILSTVVRLIERCGDILKVTGLDALDGSPILDIKPYLPDRQNLRDVTMPDWMSKMHEVFQQDPTSGGGTVSTDGR